MSTMPNYGELSVSGAINFCAYGLLVCCVVQVNLDTWYMFYMDHSYKVYCTYMHPSSSVIGSLVLLDFTSV